MADSKKKAASKPETPKKGFVSGLVNYFKDFGIAISKGNTGVKLSAVLMGAGYLINAQIVHGILVFLVEAAFIIMMVMYGGPALSKFSTLGTVKREQVFDPLTMQSTVNDYDNSFMILLVSVVILFAIFAFDKHLSV